MVEIRRTTEQDWQTLRRVRLAALREAPYAFGSTYQKERQWDDDKWREWASWGERSEEQVVFLGFDTGNRSVGMVAAFKAEEGSVQLIAMWVAPGDRRKGFGRALVQAVVRWAAGAEMRRVSLWVTDDNTSASGLYLGLGFRPTGETEPLPSDPSHQISRLDLVLSSNA
jgi:ribosomal protein S18 acetylase RimI-like enzyme